LRGRVVVIFVGVESLHEWKSKNIVILSDYGTFVVFTLVMKAVTWSSIEHVCIHVYMYDFQDGKDFTKGSLKALLPRKVCRSPWY
jgi:hypothetical protein